MLNSLLFLGGKCLIPVFALGRAQELLLILGTYIKQRTLNVKFFDMYSPYLDEYWSLHPELHDIPIYYASSLAKKCMAVYQTYINASRPKTVNKYSKGYFSTIFNSEREDP